MAPKFHDFDPIFPLDWPWWGSFLVALRAMILTQFSNWDGVGGTLLLPDGPWGHGSVLAFPLDSFDGLGVLFQPLWLRNSMILSIFPAGNGRMWAPRAAGTDRIRESSLPGENSHTRGWNSPENERPASPRQREEFQEPEILGL